MAPMRGSGTVEPIHEPLLCRAGLPAGRFGGLSSPPLDRRAGKPDEPAAWKGCPTSFIVPKRGLGPRILSMRNITMRTDHRTVTTLILEMQKVRCNVTTLVLEMKDVHCNVTMLTLKMQVVHCNVTMLILGMQEVCCNVTTLTLEMQDVHCNVSTLNRAIGDYGRILHFGATLTIKFHLFTVRRPIRCHNQPLSLSNQGFAADSSLGLQKSRWNHEAHEKHEKEGPVSIEELAFACSRPLPGRTGRLPRPSGGRPHLPLPMNRPLERRHSYRRSLAGLAATRMSPLQGSWSQYAVREPLSLPMNRSVLPASCRQDQTPPSAGKMPAARWFMVPLRGSGTVATSSKVRFHNGVPFLADPLPLYSWP